MSRQQSTKNSTVNSWEKENWKRKGKDWIDVIRSLKSVIPKRYRNINFKSLKAKSNPIAYRICQEYARNFKENYKTGKGLFITGNVGTGKTSLSAAVIDYIARLHKKRLRNFEIIFTTAIDMLSEIKYSIDRKNTEEVVENYEYCGLLVIEDLGTEKSTDWTHELFYKIIDSRYSNLLPVIITTNLTDVEIKEKLSERIISRIYEMCQGVKLTGKDYRI